MPYKEREKRREIQRTPEFRKWRRNYQRDYRQENLQFRIAGNLRSRLNTALNLNKKSGSAISDLGCSIEQLKSWLMYQFQEGMTWNNYGKWHVDHVIPLSSFDLTDRNQLLEACNWYNLQPLWALDNLRKGAK